MSESLIVQEIEKLLHNTHWYFIDTEMPDKKFKCSFVEGNLILNNVDYSKYTISQLDKDQFYIGINANPHFGARIAKITPIELILIGNNGELFPYHILKL